MSNSVNKKLRIFFIPFFASGHMIPMADFAALLARRTDVDPTLCLTQANADILRPTLDPAVNVLIYPFPSEAAGLLPGQENISSVPADQEWKINKAADLSEPTHHKLLHEHRPDAVVSDIHLWWTTGIAADLGIPRITWYAVGVFSQLVLQSLHKYRIETVGVSDGEITVKDIPGPAIKLPVSELPEFARSNDFFSKVREKLKRATYDCYGVIVNTFYEMEPTYCDHSRAAEYKRAWFVGPVALARGHNKDATVTSTERGHECLNWLDGKEEGSVVFVCYGSWCQFKDEQQKAIAAGLEKSGQSFIWVIRKSEGDWLPDQKWEDRVKGRRKVVAGWVPQVAILAHKAVGAFLTHCGWNSVMESVAAGLPMLTWPLVFEQFINEKLVVELVGIGEPVSRGFRSTREEEKVVVPAEAIAKAVSSFMENAGTGERRTKARKFAQLARAAVAEGGSSWNDLSRLVDELIALRDNRLKEA